MFGLGGGFFGGFFFVDFSGHFPWENKQEKNPPKNPPKYPRFSSQLFHQNPLREVSALIFCCWGVLGLRGSGGRVGVFESI